MLYKNNNFKLFIWKTFLMPHYDNGACHANQQDLSLVCLLESYASGILIADYRWSARRNEQNR